MKHQVDFNKQYFPFSTYSKRLLHLVWGTKEREAWLDDVTRQLVFSAFHDISGKGGWSLLEVGGFYDHVHLLCEIPPRLAVSDVVQALKSLSARHLMNIAPRGPRRAWQEGYGAFSVSWSMFDVVRKYVRNQFENHRSHGPEEPLFGADLLARLVDVEISESLRDSVVGASDPARGRAGLY